MKTPEQGQEVVEFGLHRVGVGIGEHPGNPGDRGPERGPVGARGEAQQIAGKRIGRQAVLSVAYSRVPHRFVDQRGQPDNDNRSGVGRLDTADDVQQRGLTRTTGTQDSHQLPRCQIDADFEQRMDGCRASVVRLVHRAGECRRADQQLGPGRGRW